MDGTLQSNESLSVVGRDIPRRFFRLLKDLDSELQAKALNEKQRFDLWASSLGLYHTGHSSLDYRFRDSPPLFQYALGLLKDLNETLAIIAEILEEDTLPREVGDVSDDSDDPGNGDLSSDSPEEITSDYLYNISITIDRLYALSFKIRNPTMRTGLSRAAKYTHIDPDTEVDLIDEFKKWDMRFMMDLFLDWSPTWKGIDLDQHFLVARLAAANTRRRQQFKYWEKRKAKYEHEHLLMRDEDTLDPHLDGHAQPTDTRISDHDQLSDPTTATYIQPDMMSDDGSAVSNESDVIAGDESLPDINVLPPTPDVSPDSKEFECPYCYIMCDRKTLHQRAWETHIIRDLRPYVCTFQDCKDPDQQYDTVADWLSHEASRHGHDPTTARDCPFCSDGNVTAEHVARHMRRVACFSLPRFNSESGIGDAGTGGHENRAEVDIEAFCDLTSSFDQLEQPMKTVHLILAGFGEMTAELRPDEPTDSYLIPRLKACFDLDEDIEFTFRNKNKSEITVGYDRLDDDITIFVEPSGTTLERQRTQDSDLPMDAAPVEEQSEVRAEDAQKQNEAEKKEVEGQQMQEQHRHDDTQVPPTQALVEVRRSEKEEQERYTARIRDSHSQSHTHESSNRSGELGGLRTQGCTTAVGIISNSGNAATTMSGSRNQDSYYNGRNRPSGSHSNRRSRHAGPLAELRSPAAPRNPPPAYDRTAHYQEPHYSVPGVSTHSRSSAYFDSLGYSRNQGYSGQSAYPEYRQGTAVWQGLAYEEDFQPSPHARYERIPRNEPGPGYEPDSGYDADSRYEQEYEDPDSHIDDRFGRHDYDELFGSRIRITPGHPSRIATQGGLDPRYVVQQADYFAPGKVFSILWHDNDGRDERASGTHVSAGPLFRGRYNQAIYSTIRRMVVIRAFDQHSWCFSISTYGGRGLAKPGVNVWKHAIVHMRDTPPRLGPNEPEPTKDAIEVDPERFDETLHPKSRLNFGKIYTVDHAVKSYIAARWKKQRPPYSRHAAKVRYKSLRWTRKFDTIRAGPATVQSRASARTSQPPGGLMQPSHRPGQRREAPGYDVNSYGEFNTSSPGGMDPYGEAETEDYMMEPYDYRQDYPQYHDYGQDYPQDQYHSHSRYTEYETDDDVTRAHDYPLDHEQQSRSTPTDYLDPLSELSRRSYSGWGRAQPTPTTSDASGRSSTRHFRGPLTGTPGRAA